MNMSYCRFENTAHDLADCTSALERLLLGQREEKGESIQLSASELAKAKKLASICLEYLRLIAEADNDSSLDDLGTREIDQVLDKAQYEARSKDRED